ncbi:MAG: aldose 1-epimerase [Spirochaetota bacterium]
MRNCFLITASSLLLGARIILGSASDVVFSSAVTKDGTTAWHIVELSTDDRRRPSNSMKVKICPEGGGNMFFFSVGGTELILGPEALSDLKKKQVGTLILYPTPNRVRDSNYVFQGEKHTMSFSGETRSHALHGLVWDDAWRFEEPRLGTNSISCRIWYALDRNDPRFPAFPYANTLVVQYTLLADRVRISYEVENRDGRDMGFGFGVHPFWKIIGDTDKVFIRVPLPYHMESSNYLPTGRLTMVGSNAAWDLTEFRPLSTLRLDDVFFGATPMSRVAIDYRTIGRVLHLRASADLTHVVVWTTRRYFCIENQTCSIDAHNLYDRGHVKESHLQIVRPGGKAGGYVDYIPE